MRCTAPLNPKPQTLKFESRDEWLGIRSAERPVTSDLNTTFGHRHYFYFAALLYFMRRTSTPHSSLLTPHWRAELSAIIKGRPVPRANPESPNPTTHFISPLVKDESCII